MKDKENNIIVRSKLRELCGEMSVAADFGDALNEEVLKIVAKAVERAKSNGRRTVMPKDL